MRIRLYLILPAIILCILIACSQTEPASPLPEPAESAPPSPAPQETAVQTDIPEEEPLPKPVTELTPIVITEPQLSDPLWDCRMDILYSHEIRKSSGTVTVFEAAQHDSLRLRLYQSDSGDRVIMGRTENAAGTIAAYIWETPSDGILRWYDSSAGQWQEQPISTGTTQASMIELSMDDGGSFLFWLPKTYRQQENGVLEYLPEQDGALNIARLGDHWRFSLLARLPDPGCVSDFTMVQAEQPLLNWAHSYCGELWKNYTMEGDGKWCFDGFYWPCPDNYEPTGTNYLYPCPAAYLIKSFAYAAPFHAAADHLALAMLDTMSMAQNTDGYWPTTPRSQWLYNDYGVDKGFYDTRFNTDLIEIYRVYYEYAGGDTLLASMEAYADFFLDFAEQAHFTTEQGGWLIPDYEPAERTPHCSLNHQLAECIELYHLSDVLQRPELEELADRMLLAIANIGSRWLKENGDLHYCIFSDGSMGLQDYPYLTYNDLAELQNLLIQRRGTPDDTLRLLMDSKRQWMDANGITGYQK